MISLRVIAVILLLLRSGSAVYIGLVLRKQYRLLKRPIKDIQYYSDMEKKRLMQFRMVLFVLATAIFLGNLVPIVVDTLTILGTDLSRPKNIHTISVLYVISNATTAFISAYLIHTLYRLAADEKTTTNNTAQALREEVKRK